MEKNKVKYLGSLQSIILDSGQSYTDVQEKRYKMRYIRLVLSVKKQITRVNMWYKILDNVLTINITKPFEFDGNNPCVMIWVSLTILLYQYIANIYEYELCCQSIAIFWPLNHDIKVCMISNVRWNQRTIWHLHRPTFPVHFGKWFSACKRPLVIWLILFIWYCVRIFYKINILQIQYPIHVAN